MEMQIPQLRQLFEARVGQIASVLSKDPPPEVGNVEPTLRGLKGFLLSLEGMLRKNDLHGLPFTARQELFDRVDQASEAIRALPGSLNRDQALGIMRAMDGLHRLCLQENLMASGLDASKLGKITVILERKLGEVLETIDGIAAAGEGRVRQIEQTTQDCLAEIQGTYEKEARTLGNGASQAVESLRSRTETIRKRQAEALEAIDKLPHEITQKRLHCQGQLDRQLAAAQRAVTEVQDEQVAMQELAVEVRAQLDSARTAIEEMTEIAQAAETARDDLRAKLAEGQDVVESIRALLADGGQGAKDASDKAAQAARHLAGIQQTADQCTELADAARQQQDQAVSAVQAIAHAAERMGAETKAKLDEQVRAAAKVLAGIESNGQTADEMLEQVRQRRQLADEGGQAIAEAKQAAGETLQQASRDLTQLQALLDQSSRVAEQLDEFVRTGDDLTARMGQALAEADQSRQRTAQIEGDTADAANTIRQRKEEALEAGRDAVAQAQRQQSQFELAVSQHRESARDAVAGLRSDQAIAADLLRRTQQDIETLQGEMKQIHDIRTTASDAQGDLREKLVQASSVTEKLGQALAEVGELKTQVVAHLADSAGARTRLERMEQDAAAACEDLGRRQARALEAIRGEADALAEQREAREASFAEQRTTYEASLTELRMAYEASLAEQLESARGVVADLRARKGSADSLLEQARQQRDAAHAAGQATAEARLATAQATGEVQAKLHEARTAAADLAGLLSAGAESRSKIDAELAAAAGAASQVGDIRRDLGEFFDNVRQHKQEMAQVGERSQQLIADLRSSGQEALAGIERQTADLLARGGQLQQEVEDLLGSAADGGLYKQFDDLAARSAPRRRKWLLLLVGAGGGGAGVLATVSSIIAASWPWAGIALLAAGLVPLAIFLYFCVTQYNAERHAETQNQYRAAVSRSLAAYRKLLAAMKAEGLADSAHVDRMLSALFGQAADDSLPPATAAATATRPAAERDHDEQDRQ